MVPTVPENLITSEPSLTSKPSMTSTIQDPNGQVAIIIGFRKLIERNSTNNSLCHSSADTVYDLPFSYPKEGLFIQKNEKN